MAHLIEAIEGLGEACRFFDAPITGGNVSLYNETLGEPIYPTPVIGVVGLLPTRPAVASTFQRPGRKLVLVGGLLPGGSDQLERRFGSSQFAKVILEKLWGLPPALDLVYEKRVHEAVREIVRSQLAESVHDLSDGGLAVAVAECSFGPARIGARIEVESPAASHYVLFHEAPSRILLSIDPRDLRVIQDIVSRHNVEGTVIGDTISETLSFRVNGRMVVEAGVAALHARWAGGLGA
jgi:phosphoribosylformylglycinamidine synthase